MEDEYISFYELYSPLYGPKTAIFMQVGSFYELYDILDNGVGKTSCKEAVDTMGIALTTKKGEPGCTLFAGFPENSLHKWAGRLTQLGWTVVVVDQVKDSAGRVVKRKVSSILSPGTHLEAASVDAVYLCSLYLHHIDDQPPRFGAASIDLTTGSTTSYEGVAQGRQDEWIADTLMHFFQVHNPKELAVWYYGPPMLKPDENTIRRVLSLHPLTSIHIRDHYKVNHLQTEEIFQRIFKPKTLLPILTWLDIQSTSSPAALALVNLLNFVEDHLPSSLDILQSHTSWKPEEHVFVGNNAFSQVQFIGRDTDSVLTIFNKCLTPMGKRAIKQRLLIPITDPAILQRRYDSIEHIKQLPATTRKSLEAALRAMYDLPRLHRKIQCISPTAQDIMALYQSYEAAKDLLAIDPVQTAKPTLQMIQTLIDSLLKSFSIEKAQIESDDIKFLNDSFLKTKAQEVCLKDWQNEVDELGKKLQTWAGLKGESLRLEWRESMCGFRASKSSLQTIKMKFPIHSNSCPIKDIDISLQKSGGWIEAPYFTQHFYRVLGARSKLKTAFLDELPTACEQFSQTHEFWEILESWISEIDMILCYCRVAEERGFSRPVLNIQSSSHLDIRGLRHPLIESIQTRSEYVKHDVALNDSCKGWLVYGMNASGKSSLMKAVGIAVLLAQSGSYVPATYMSYSPFHSVLTRILNQDNLWAGLSSFTVEMSELREILRRADRHSLVLGDELCSGTESVSATSLVAAGIQTLLKAGSRFLFATHFHGLTKVFSTLPEGLAVWHLRVKYDAVLEKLFYDRSLHPGPGSTLYGLEVARAMDLPKDFLELATTYRRGLMGAVNEEEAPASKWNKEIKRRFCEICGVDAVRELEVHHIRERNQAIKGHFSDGSSMNHVRNLVVLCELCHDKHHRGELHIGQMKQTSDGFEREVIPVDTKTITVESEAVENDEDVVKQYLRDHPAMPLKSISFFLKQKGIKLTSQRLSAIRKKL